MKKLNDRLRVYQSLIEDSDIKLSKVRRRIHLIGLLRLLMFIATGAFIYLYFAHDRNPGFLLAAMAGIACFLGLVKRHARWFTRKEYLKQKIDVNRQELQAMNYDFSAFDDGREFADPAHLYTFDLDVFGRNSLFQAINRTATPIGKEHLAAWFNSPPEQKEDIRQRQEAIEELAEDLAFRQRFRIFGLLNKAQATDSETLREWVARPSQFRKRMLFRILPATALIANACCIGGALAGWFSWSLTGAVFAGFSMLGFSFARRITRMQFNDGKRLQILSTYADQLSLIERKTVKAATLQTLKAELERADGLSACKAVGELSRKLDLLDQRSNLLVSTLLNGAFLWELRQVMLIERWKETHATDLPRWLAAIGEMDAYCSLATFAYNHPDYVYPTLHEGEFRLQAVALGHPLMPRDRCVRNDIDIDKSPSFIIITGANMAGKSTYLRTVGANYLLAGLGAPVWAERMEFSPARLVTSLRTTDSLTDNESYFFAELKRLKMIIDRLEAGEKLFIILDEILKGTNSTDKQRGSLALVRQFMTLRTHGIIATHDLLLGSLADAFPNDIRNYCFEADIANDELSFSYRMREGIAQNMNACFLMKKMGIVGVEEA